MRVIHQQENVVSGEQASDVKEGLIGGVLESRHLQIAVPLLREYLGVFHAMLMSVLLVMVMIMCVGV